MKSKYSPPDQQFLWGNLHSSGNTPLPASITSHAPAPDLTPGAELAQIEVEDEHLDECRWSSSVALDPKHQPQRFDQPSSTVRREWCRYPQEAHILDDKKWRYRRLTVDEIAIIQGFDPGWFDIPGMSNRNRIRAIGDAVPPPMAKAIFRAIDLAWNWKRKSAIEICAGSGGLASGAAVISGMEHMLLLDRWVQAGEILRHGKPWSPDRVHVGDAKEFDFGKFRGRVGLLSGGPPCQPWSQGGVHGGLSDSRDLLWEAHEIISAIEPEVFLFENVPGLISEQNQQYFHAILERLRRPGESGCRYGVAAGLFNAADFGVPQVRRRIFFLGFRDRPVSFAHQVFDRLHSSASHRDPAKPHPTRQRWVRLVDAFAGRPDPGCWRRWVSDDEDGPKEEGRDSEQ